MEVGDYLTATPKQLIYLKQRFRKYKYKMFYEKIEGGKVRAHREA